MQMLEVKKFTFNSMQEAMMKELVGSCERDAMGCTTFLKNGNTNLFFEDFWSHLKALMNKVVVLAYFTTIIMHTC